MDWFTDRRCFLLAVVIYGVSMIYSIFLWRRGFRKDNWVNYVLLLGGFGFHTAAMILRGFRFDHCPVHNLYEATTFFLWASLAIYLVMGVWSRLQFLGAFASPFLFCVGVFALMPGLDGRHGAEPGMARTLTSVHAAVMAISYGAFGLSATAAAMYLTQEYNLKFRKLQAILARLPPIQRLETIVNRLLIAGFVLLTIGLALGAYELATLQNSRDYRGDVKIAWSMLVWVLYLGLIVMRWKFAHRGRRFALGVIGSFSFVLLTFWWSNMLSRLHNP